MKTKKHRIFLLISLAVFFVTAIIGIIYLCKLNAEIYSHPYINSDTQLRVGLELQLIGAAFFIAAVLATELSFIRSVYKMLKFKPKKWVRICYIISASLAFITIAFFCLVFFDIIDFIDSSGYDYTADILFIGLWPSFILSFILGSMPSGFLSEICKYD